MSSFFTKPSTQKKRKRLETDEVPKKRINSSKTPREPKPARKPQRERDESISGSDDESANGGAEDDAEPLTSGSDGEGETAAERRLRLAERYLESKKQEIDEYGYDAEEIDRDLLAERLQEDVAESKGRMYRKLADELDFEGANSSWARWNSETVTSVAMCAPWAYTVDKKLGLAKWKIQELPEHQWLPRAGRKRQKKPTPPPKRKPDQVAYVKGDKSKAKDTSYQGHTDIILAVAASQDGKFVVTGGQDRKIIVWDAATLKPLRVFSHHRDAVTGLSFRRGTNQLFSSSKDRTIKTWSLNELAYVETLFGHQDEVVDVAALAQERCISVGARDRTARLWKVVEETQLVFRGGGGEKRSKKHDTHGGLRTQEGSIDRVAMIDDEMFVTGSDNGSLSLWAIHKKKPVHTISLCHGIEPALKPEEASAEMHPDESIVPQPGPRWITALTTIPYSDVVMSGSWDGFVRVWRVSEDKKKLEVVGCISTSTSTTTSILSLRPPVSTTNGHKDTDTDMDADLPSTNGNTPSKPEDEEEEQQPKGPVQGVVNDISIFERGDRGKDGLCVFVGVGKEHRMGRWIRGKGWKNGAVIFEVSKIVKPKVNGVAAAEKEVEEE